MVKIANVFGRLEAFSFSILLYVVGYIQMAGSNNVKTFASAQIFYSAGFTGLQILNKFISQIRVISSTEHWSQIFPTFPS